MCTFAWETGTNGDLWACFNRDEQRSRAAAEAPCLYPGPQGTLGYARDPEGGGTWLAVSSQGFAVALLNSYATGGSLSKGGGRSRGLLVRDLAATASGEEAEKALRNGQPEAYAPFHLFILSPEGVLKADWDGTRLTLGEARDGWFTTSSYRPGSIPVIRKKAWDDFHANHPEAGRAALARRLREKAPDPAEGMTMDRDDARTVSQTEVRTGTGGFTMVYRARAADGDGFEDPLMLTYPEEGPVHGREG
ncbi:MAG: NRDE family protein [Oceanipulchritudo sp.]